MRADILEKRLAMVRQFDGAGLTRKEVAERLGWCVESVSKYRKMLDADFRHALKRTGVTEREKAMAAMYRVGKTLQEIGEVYGVSRERVRQILARHFKFDAKDGGQTVKASAKKVVQKRERDAKSLEKYGCSHDEYRRISNYGKAQVAAGERPCRNPVTAFNSQRAMARARSIEWNLKLWDWWQIWQSSGKWDARGRNKGEYVMCRFKDAGAYEVGNVYIATNSHNCSLQPNNPHRSSHPDHDEYVKARRASRSPVANRTSRRGLLTQCSSMGAAE